jgi:hypothetical protein
VTYEYQITGPVEYTPGNAFNRENIAGRQGGNTSGIGPILSWDTRNNAYSPDKGGSSPPPARSPRPQAVSKRSSYAKPSKACASAPRCPRG